MYRTSSYYVRPLWPLNAPVKHVVQRVRGKRVETRSGSGLVPRKVGCRRGARLLLVLEPPLLAPAEEAHAAAAAAGGRRAVGHRGQHGEALVEALERDEAALVHPHVLQQGAHLAQEEARRYERWRGVGRQRTGRLRARTLRVVKCLKGERPGKAAGKESGVCVCEQGGRVRGARACLVSGEWTVAEARREECSAERVLVDEAGRTLEQLEGGVRLELRHQLGRRGRHAAAQRALQRRALAAVMRGQVAQAELAREAARRGVRRLALV